MNGLQTLDRAEIQLAEQFLGCDIPLYGSNVEVIRTKIKESIFEDVRRLLTLARSKPPLDPREIARFWKVLSVVEDPSLVSGEACLNPIDGGFIIRLNPRIPRLKRRFNCAHEIAHTYFYNVSVNPPERFYPRARYWVEEGYACEIAREILIPEPYLSDFAIRNCSYPSLRTLLELRTYFDVSYDALALRLLHDAHLWNKRFWRDKLWEGLIITIYLSDNYDIEQGLKIKVYRSPKYRNRLTNITSNKLKNPKKKNIRNYELFKRFRDHIFESLERGIHEAIVRTGKDIYCVEACKVGSKAGVALIHNSP